MTDLKQPVLSAAGAGLASYIMLREQSPAVMTAGVAGIASFLFNGPLEEQVSSVADADIATGIVTGAYSYFMGATDPMYLVVVAGGSYGLPKLVAMLMPDSPLEKQANA